MDTTATSSPNSTAETSSTGDGADKTTESDFKPITTQQDLNRIVSERLSRERAKYSDYESLKAKAAKFDEAEEASKTELEKAQSRAEKAEAKLKSLAHELQITAWKEQVSKETGIPADVLRGVTLEELNSHADALKTLIVPHTTKQGGYLPREGSNESEITPLNSNALLDALKAAVGKA